MTRENLQRDGIGAPVKLARVARRWINSRRFRPILLLCAALVVMFSLQRSLLAVLSGQMLEGVSPRDILALFAKGLREDLRVLAWLIMPLVPLLSLTPNRLFTRTWLRSVLAAYITGAIVLAMAVCTVDTLFFLRQHARLNWQAPNYLGEGEIVTHLWRHYPVVLIALALAAVMMGVFRVAQRLCGDGPAPVGRPLGRVTFGVVLLALAGVGAHRPKEQPIGSSSQAYFSTNSMVSELAFNPVVTGSSAVKDYITEGEDEPERYELLSTSTAFTVVRTALRQDHTIFDGGALNPLWRTVHTGRPRRAPNVVMIIMESFAGSNVGALGHETSETPFFDSLADRSVFFSHMYAAGTRTSRGLTALLCGFPDLGGKSILTRTAAQGRFPSLFQVFADRGYETSFIYGGDSEFDNMKRFFGAAGLQHMVDIHTLPAGTWRTGWGIADHEVFARADEFYNRPRTRPFFSVVLTVTNHSPFKVPPGCIGPGHSEDEDGRMAQTLRYADWALEQFFAAAADREYYNETVFVLVADHGQRLDPRRLVDVEGSRIPCLIYAPGLADVPPRRIDVPCSQTDVWPTLLSLLGGEFSHGTFGRDLLAVSPSDPGMALLRKDRSMALVRGDVALVALPDSDPVVFRRTGVGEEVRLNGAALLFDDATDMYRTAMGFYQSARELYLRQAYGLQPRSYAQGNGPLNDGARQAR